MNVNPLFNDGGGECRNWKGVFDVLTWILKEHSYIYIYIYIYVTKRISKSECFIEMTNNSILNLH